jgi:hypothetical protein
MNTLVEQNKPLLRICCITARIYGWLLLSLGWSAVVGHSFALATRIGEWELFSDYARGLPWNVISGAIVGILVLGIAQFIRFLMDNDYKPGWILKNIESLLFTYAVLVGLYVIVITALSLSHWDQWVEIIVRIVARLIWSTGNILILVGTALIIKRIMPVIEESRTLV